MFQFLLQVDKTLFTYINHLPHNLVFDSFFTFFSAVGYSGIIWFAIGTAIFIWEEIKDKRGLIALTLSGFFSLFVEFGLKNLIGRLRPQFKIPQAIVVWDPSRSFSFPSGHTTIAFAAAYVLSNKHKKYAFLYYLLAGIISFSRIYLGKHYPSDVASGIIIGTVIGFFSLIITKRLKLNKHDKT